MEVSLSKSEATSVSSSWLELPGWQGEISLSWISTAVGNSLRSLSDLPNANAISFKQFIPYDFHSPPTEDHDAEIDGGSFASVYGDEREISWCDLDEERNCPIQDDSVPYSICENGEKQPNNGKAARAASTMQFRQFSASWFKEKFHAVGNRWLIALFFIAVVLVVADMGSDTKDAVDEFGKYTEDWTGGDNGQGPEPGLMATNDQLDELPHPQLSGGSLDDKREDNLGAATSFPPSPPSNLAGMCSSNDEREQCIATCSEAECCFVPWWNPKSCCREKICRVYVDACSLLEDGGKNCKGKCEEVGKDKEGGENRNRRRGR